jgi:hypothetical protein
VLYLCPFSTDVCRFSVSDICATSAGGLGTRKTLGVARPGTQTSLYRTYPTLFESQGELQSWLASCMGVVLYLCPFSTDVCRFSVSDNIVCRVFRWALGPQDTWCSSPWHSNFVVSHLTHTL